MRILLICAALLVARPAAAECGWFVHEHDPDLIIHEEMTKLTLHSRHGVDEYRVAIDQSFGILKNMAFKNLGDMDGIPYIRREIDGREAIIFNSMVFFAVCPE